MFQLVCDAKPDQQDGVDLICQVSIHNIPVIYNGLEIYLTLNKARPQIDQ